jgi:hypothetical protein
MVYVLIPDQKNFIVLFNADSAELNVTSGKISGEKITGIGSVLLSKK